MANDAAHFRERAEIERANADAATLDNVRDRCERASAAWAAMADRYDRSRSEQSAREAEAAAARDARRTERAVDTDRNLVH